MLRWFFDRQRLIHTFATACPAPARPLTFAGAPVRVVIPVPNTTGDVTITFGVLSYAGTLWSPSCPIPAGCRMWRC